MTKELDTFSYAFMVELVDCPKRNAFPCRKGKPEMFRFPGGYYSFDEEGKKIADWIKNGHLCSSDIDEAMLKYDLSGYSGLLQYLADVATIYSLGTNGGNIGTAFLGSCDLQWSVLFMFGKNAIVGIEVNNSTTIASGTRLPVLGYTSWWNDNIGNSLNNRFSTGPMSITTQKFVWLELINLQ